MNRIRLLPEQVANQIAAGEVVERPASIVKELVENALDAQARRITVEIQAGGRSLVRVTDDGTGMSRDDALLSLERHATSKIRKAEDLGAIATMGFRGEALPSIASVSRFTLTTREQQDKEAADPAEATRVVVSGGKIQEVKAAGSPPGTCVEVRQVFFNLPARRKFLRSEQTEAAHIQHYLTLAALAHPAVAFTYVKDGRTVWQLPSIATEGPLEALCERYKVIYGGEPKMLAVDQAGGLTPPAAEEDDWAAGQTEYAIRLWGLIGAPGVSRGTREEQHLFVNRRPVENRGINAALIEGYHTALMKGRYPVCCLFLEIDPALVDVNIHPAKREVKFHNERAVRAFVSRSIRQTLLDFHKPPAADASAPAPAPYRPASPSTLEPKRESPASRPEPGPEPLEPPGQLSLPAVPSRTAPRAAIPAAPVPRPPGAPSPPLAEATGETAPPAHEPTPLLHVPLRLVGVIGKLYVVLESDRGLVLLDQHAAHERILYEQMMNRLERNEAAVAQRLLLPETVELPPRDAQFLREQLTTLTRLGVGLSEFGERTFLLDALPPFVKTADARTFVLGLVDELKAVGSEVNTLRLGEHTVAKTVCRHAVKANDPLAGLELENLIKDLRQCDMPYTCPHGRPTMIEMSHRELEKKFGRVQ